MGERGKEQPMDEMDWMDGAVCLGFVGGLIVGASL
jgi:hypothetical protein